MKTDWPLIFSILFVLACLGGWCANIAKLAGMIHDPLTAMAILRIVGIVFPPVGVVLGYV